MQPEEANRKDVRLPGLAGCRVRPDSLTYLLLLLPSPLIAGEPKAHRGLACAEPKTERQTLDVYAPTGGKNHPVVVWIHGGGWQAGDKKEVHTKPRAFTDKGFVFVSVNDRLPPEVTINQLAGDLAKAIRWAHDHAKDYGGDPRTIFVMGIPPGRNWRRWSAPTTAT